MEYKTNILIVEDRKPWLEKFGAILDSNEYQIELANSLSEARTVLDRKKFDLTIMNWHVRNKYPNSFDGNQLIFHIMYRKVETRLIVFIDHEIDHIREVYADKHDRHFNILAFFTKSNFDLEQFISIVENVKQQHIKEWNAFQQEQLKRQEEQSMRSRQAKNLDNMKHSNHFRSLLQTAIDLYSRIKKRSFDDVLNEINNQLGYGRDSMAVQSWLQENTIPNAIDVEYLAKMIMTVTDLDKKWLKEFFDAAGYEVPKNFSVSIITASQISSSNTSSVALRDPLPVASPNVAIPAPSHLEHPIEIFISYARTDVAIVTSIYQTLLASKYHCWMDIYSITGGQEWLRAIYRAIEQSSIFLAVLSNNSVSRRGVIQRELRRALDKWEDMLPDDIYIIPVRIDDCPIPELLRRIQVLDWNNGKGVDKLLQAINIGLAKRKNS